MEIGAGTIILTLLALAFPPFAAVLVLVLLFKARKSSKSVAATGQSVRSTPVYVSCNRCGQEMTRSAKSCMKCGKVVPQRVAHRAELASPLSQWVVGSFQSSSSVHLRSLQPLWSGDDEASYFLHELSQAR
jgi:hypothetical protein